MPVFPIKGDHMNVSKANTEAMQARYEAAAAMQKNKADQAQQQKASEAAQEAKKTKEEKPGTALKGGEINVTA
jgi:hypothetical protein